MSRSSRTAAKASTVADFNCARAIKIDPEIARTIINFSPQQKVGFADSISETARRVRACIALREDLQGTIDRLSVNDMRTLALGLEMAARAARAAAKRGGAK